MLTANHFNAIRTQLSLLDCDYDDYPLASSYYLTYQYLRRHDIGTTDIDKINDALSSDGFSVFRQTLQLTSEFTADITPKLIAFCQALSSLDLDNDPIGFYSLLWPYLVHDQSAFSLYENDHLRQSIALHVILSIASQYEASSIPTELAFDDFNSWQDSIRPYFPEASDLSTVFEDLWRACFYTEMRVPIFKSRPAIKNYLDYCRDANISPTENLSHYEKVYRDATKFRSFKAHLSDAEMDPYFESYGSDFVRILVGLRSEPPAFLLHALHYTDSAGSNPDDFEFEASFFANVLFSTLKSSTSRLILFPTPSFIYYFCNKVATGVMTTVLISDEFACSLLHSEFPNVQFLTPAQLVQETKTFDSVVAFTHQAHQFPFAEIVRILDINAPILALIPQTHFTHKKYVRSLYENDIYINRIVVIPPNLTRSLPRKKALVYAQKKSSAAIPPPVQLFFASANSAKLIRVPNRDITFDSSALFQGRTLIQLYNSFSLAAKADTGEMGSYIRECEWLPPS